MRVTSVVRKLYLMILNHRLSVSRFPDDKGLCTGSRTMDEPKVMRNSNRATGSPLSIS
jgi:hypothetical protein